MSASQINRHFDQYPTARVLLAPWIGRTDPLTTAMDADTVAAPPGRPLAEDGLPRPGGSRQHNPRRR